MASAWEGQRVTIQKNGSAPGSRPSPWRLLPLALLLLGAAAVFATGAHRYLSLEALIQQREQLQSFVASRGSTAMLVYMAIYVTAVTLSVPGAVFLTIIGGFLFGWLVGGAAAAIAATLGATGVFLIARTSIGDVLARKAGPRLQNLAEGFRRDAFSYLLFLRFLPIMPFWLTNLAPALLGVPARTFALASLIGLVPATFTFAGIGASLETLIAGQKAELEQCVASGAVNCSFEPSVWALLQPQHIAAFAALGVLSLVPVLVRRWRRHAEPAHSGPAQERAP